MNSLAVGWIVLVASAVMSTGACGGRTDEQLSPDGGSGNNFGGGSSDQGGNSGSNGTIPTSFTSAQVQAAIATCNQPHGSVVNVASDNDELANATGAWVLCPGSADAGPPTMFGPGILLEPDGSFEALTPTADGSGGLQASSGVQNQGKWTVGCEESSGLTGSQPCPDIDVQLHAVSGDVTPTACYGGSITFESSPRRMYVVDWPALWCDVQSTAPTFDLWLVPLN